MEKSPVANSMTNADIKEGFEKVRKQAAKDMEKYNRFLPMDEMLLDRWKKAELLGFGEKTSVYENVYIYGKPIVGKNVWVGPFVILDATGGLKIGDGCDISCGAMIFTHDTCLRCISEGQIDTIKKPVTIGNHTYIGSGAIILAGVEIGDNCVIGAGAIVTKNISSNSVVVGVPARKVGNVILKGKSIKIEYFNGQTTGVV